jgi:hypothetical protein
VTRTTGATVDGALTLPREGDVAPPARSSPAPNVSPPREEQRPAPSVERHLPPYERPPLHEPRGASYSDVGLPYPLPDVPEVGLPPRIAPAPVGQPSSFPETSFGAEPPDRTESGRFPESSFGPDATP